MQKLIELLNEFDKPLGWYYEDGVLDCKLNLYEYMAYEWVCSARYGFIEWLVENEKIAYDIPNNSDLYKCFELACIPLDNTDYITMLLSIQDEPIEFLVSILK